MIALEIVSSADPVRDKNSAASFVAQAHEKTEVVVDSKEPERAVLQVLALPIAIVNQLVIYSFAACVPALFPCCAAVRNSAASRAFGAE